MAPAGTSKPKGNIPDSQVGHPDEPEMETEPHLTTTANMIQSREIEVDPVDAPPLQSDSQQMVIIRMNTTIEDFTYGNPYMHIKLEAGRRYRVPAHIAGYLDGLGYVWH